LNATPLQAAGLKSVKKWRKSAAADHGILLSVTFVSAMAEFRKQAAITSPEKTQ
jgi:hypothetical protein